MHMACAPAPWPDRLFTAFHGVGIAFEGSLPLARTRPCPEVRSIGSARPAMQGNDGTWPICSFFGHVSVPAAGGEICRVSACAVGRTGGVSGLAVLQRGLRGHGLGLARAAHQPAQLIRRHGRGGLRRDTAARARLQSLGARRAGRLRTAGVPGEPGPGLDHLDHPTRSLLMADAPTWPTTATGAWWWPPPRSVLDTSSGFRRGRGVGRSWR